MSHSYEQLRALVILRDNPDMEGSELCHQADCSFEELYNLDADGLIDIGRERLRRMHLHPTLTKAGIEMINSSGIEEDDESAG